MFADGIAHVITVILISGAIVTVGAIVLHPAGLKIKAPAQMAAMLKPVLGTFANPVMGLALLGAAFQAFLVIHSAASYFSMLGWIGPSVLSQNVSVGPVLLVFSLVSSFALLTVVLRHS